VACPPKGRKWRGFRGIEILRSSLKTRPRGSSIEYTLPEKSTDSRQAAYLIIIITIIIAIIIGDVAATEDLVMSYEL
jgi:hypothetical protein